MHNKKISNYGDITTLKTPCLNKRICPHWSSPSRVCLLVTDGLFLPLDQYVTTYCLSNHYPFCLHYQLLAGVENEAGQEQANPINRRRSIRTLSHYTFRFSEITGNEQIPGLREDDAWTVDLSDHGIHFTGRQLLTSDTTIRFSLQADDMAAEAEGTGRVVWCEPLENTPLFHTGIVFTDQPNPMLLPHHRFLQQA